MPTSILSKLNKLCWSFLWSNKKKASVNVQTCQLPRELGGLGYPDISTYIGSLKAKWVIKLLNNLTPKDQPQDQWCTLAQWNLANINHKYGHDLSTIICPSTHQSAGNSPSRFWSEAIQAFWKLKPHYKIEEDDGIDNLTIRTLPLFNNPIIKNKNGKPLTGQTWLKYTSRGICRLTDIIFYDHIGSRNELFEYYGWRPTKRSYRILKKAIPQKIKLIIANYPTQVKKDTQYGWKINGNTHKVIMTDTVDPEYFTAEVFEVDEPFDSGVVRSLGRQTFTDNTTIRPIYLNFNQDDTLKDITYLDISPIIPRKVTLGKDHIKPPTTTKELRKLMSTPPRSPKNQHKWPQVNWKIVYKKFWKAPVPKKWSANHWLLLTQSFYLGEKAAMTGWDGIPHNCTHCDTIESHLHLFLHCPMAQIIWTWVINIWNQMTKCHLTTFEARHLAEAGSISPNKFPGSKRYLPIWQSLVRAGIHTIWTTRCLQVHGDTQKTPLTTLITYKNNLKKLITHQFYSPKYHHLTNLWTTQQIIAHTTSTFLKEVHFSWFP